MGTIFASSLSSSFGQGDRCTYKNGFCWTSFSPNSTSTLSTCCSMFWFCIVQSVSQATWDLSQGCLLPESTSALSEDSKLADICRLERLNFDKSQICILRLLRIVNRESARDFCRYRLYLSNDCWPWGILIVGICHHHFGVFKFAFSSGEKREKWEKWEMDWKLWHRIRSVTWSLNQKLFNLCLVVIMGYPIPPTNGS